MGLSRLPGESINQTNCLVKKFCPISYGIQVRMRELISMPISFQSNRTGFTNSYLTHKGFDRCSLR